MKTRPLKNYGASVGLEAYDIDWTSKEELEDTSDDECMDEEYENCVMEGKNPLEEDKFKEIPFSEATFWINLICSGPISLAGDISKFGPISSSAKQLRCKALRKARPSARVSAIAVG